MWGSWNPCALLVGMENSAATVENSMEVPQKIKNRITIRSSNLTSGHISKRIQSRISKRYLHTYVHRSIIHSSQEMEATQMSTGKWVDKENVVCAYNAISCSLKKEGHTVTCYNMDEPWRHYIKLNKESQKDKYCIQSYEVSKVVKILETGSRKVVTKSLGEGD